MNIRDKKIKIRFQNGEIRTLRPVEPHIVPLKKYFKRYTGIRYNFKRQYFFTQVTKSLKKWLGKYGLHHPAASGLIVAAEGIIASEQRRYSDGFIAFTEEDEECLLVIFPPDGGDYVWRISKMIYDENIM